jgi:hypothetical protein
VNLRWTIVLASVWLAFASAGDVTINFRNNILFGYARVVIQDGWTGRTTALVGSEWVAQLFWIPTDTGNPEPVGATAKFRDIPPQPDYLAGTWSGGIRSITGLDPDTEVTLLVRVWKGIYPTYECAARAGYAGQSPTFTYRNKLSDPSHQDDLSMDNFRGFTILVYMQDGCIFPNPVPTAAVTVPENGIGNVTVWSAVVSAEAALSQTSIRPKGILTGSGTNLVYQAPTNYYGTDAFTVMVPGPCGCDLPQAVMVTIAPSSERKYGKLIVGPEPLGKPLFFGLTNRVYQIHMSWDLSAWKFLNYTRGAEQSISLPNPLSDWDRTTFFRVVADGP